MSDGSPERRLASIYHELARLGIPSLIMGGHAVRFYGVDRSTLDFDLVVALRIEAWLTLPEQLGTSPIFAEAREGPSWRPQSFRRFIVGTLPDGREERLEFWRENHLLAPFGELEARKMLGEYGGAVLGFLGLDDLIRSKETERDDDWRDIRLLEEIADEKRLLTLAGGESVSTALALIRSLRGFRMAVERGLLKPGPQADEAASRAVHPVSRAFLAPYAKLAPDGDEDTPVKQLIDALRRVEPGSSRHLALVEAVRRLYQRKRMSEDRADKERDANRA